MLKHLAKGNLSEVYLVLYMSSMLLRVSSSQQDTQ